MKYSVVCATHKINIKAQVGLLLPRFLIFRLHFGLVVTHVIQDRLLLHACVVVTVVGGLLLAGACVPAAAVVVAMHVKAFWPDFGLRPIRSVLSF